MRLHSFLLSLIYLFIHSFILSILVYLHARVHIQESPKKLETGLRPNSAGIPYTLLLRIEAIGFPTVGLLLYVYVCVHMCVTRFL